MKQQPYIALPVFTTVYTHGLSNSTMQAYQGKKKRFKAELGKRARSSGTGWMQGGDDFVEETETALK